MTALLTALAQSLALGLQLVNTVESRKYLDKVIKLQKELSDELLKPDQDQSDLTIIELQRELLDLNKAFLSFKPTDSGKPS